MKIGNSHHSSLKKRAIEEFEAYWIIVLYLALFLGALTTYRRLILAEFGIVYVHSRVSPPSSRKSWQSAARGAVLFPAERGV